MKHNGPIRQARCRVRREHPVTLEFLAEQQQRILNDLAATRERIRC
jgi:hypothetical protein